MRGIKFSVAIFAVLAVTILSSCDNKDDNDLPELKDIYTPPANLSESGIKDLLKEAYLATFEINRVTTTAFGKTHNDDYTKKMIFSFDKKAKKSLEIEYRNDVLREMDYVENLKDYLYHINHDENNKKLLFNLVDIYWENYSVLGIGAELVEFVEQLIPALKNCSVAGDTIYAEVAEIGGNAVGKLSITLNVDKLIKNGHYVSGSGANKDDWRMDFDYKTEIAVPDEFKPLSDFKLYTEHSCKVIYGEGLGEQIFYATRNSYSGNMPNKAVSFDEYGILKYVPKVAGKKPEFYRDAAFTEKVNYSVSVAYADVTVYVKWVNN